MVVTSILKVLMTNGQGFHKVIGCCVFLIRLICDEIFSGVMSYSSEYVCVILRVLILK